MLLSENIKELLQETIKPVQLLEGSTPPQYTSMIITSKGSILWYVNGTTPESYNSSLTNLKMMALLIKDKWCEDQESTPADAIHHFELEDLHIALAKIPDSELLLVLIAGNEFPNGLLGLKLKYVLPAFHDLQGYKLSS
ncbi:Slm4 [Kluyveromyces lactis]|nr:Slm4 [Kluyveromyces lactis]